MDKKMLIFYTVYQKTLFKVTWQDNFLSFYNSVKNFLFRRIYIWDRVLT